VLRGARNGIRYRIRKHILRNSTVVDEWFHDLGDDTLSVRHALDGSSVVFEVGGYQGNWASRIVELYNPAVYIFEPVESFYRVIAERFAGNQNVRALQCGLGDKDEVCEISTMGDASSRFLGSAARERVQLRDIYDFVVESGIAQIDLIQINIEGGEYSLLNRMLETGLVKRCRLIQVQFHKLDAADEGRRESLRQRLSTTHELVWDYPFVWEQWRRVAPDCG
jgi:FkbM family methyltransferase